MRILLLNHFIHATNKIYNYILYNHPKYEDVNCDIGGFSVYQNRVFEIDKKFTSLEKYASTWIKDIFDLEMSNYFDNVYSNVENKINSNNNNGRGYDSEVDKAAATIIHIACMYYFDKCWSINSDNGNVAENAEKDSNIIRFLKHYLLNEKSYTNEGYGNDYEYIKNDPRIQFTLFSYFCLIDKLDDTSNISNFRFKNKCLNKFWQLFDKKKKEALFMIKPEYSIDFLQSIISNRITKRCIEIIMLYDTYHDENIFIDRFNKLL